MPNGILVTSYFYNGLIKPVGKIAPQKQKPE